jgi:hypothetical protein
MPATIVHESFQLNQLAEFRRFRIRFLGIHIGLQISAKFVVSADDIHGQSALRAALTLETPHCLRSERRRGGDLFLIETYHRRNSREPHYSFDLREFARGTKGVSEDRQ